MSERNRGTTKLFKRRAALCLTAGAFLLSGCQLYEHSNYPDEAELPSVTDYVSEARKYRLTETETSFTTFTTTEASKAEGADSQTVSSGDAASSQHESEAETTEEPVTETVPTETSPAQTETEVTEAPVQTAPVSETAAQTIELETECYVPAAQSPAPSNVYDSEFFSSDLFIGDSISTGYSLYGFLDDKNVYAKIGLNPSTVLTKAVVTCYGEIGVCSMLNYTTPDHVYIMLGSNGIQWLSVGNMLQSTDTLVGLIKDTCPDAETVIISVPPVTPKYNNSVEDVDVMAKINEYNTSLNAYCCANDMLFVDVASVLKDETGFFNTTYAESDGMHFKSPAYKVVLSKIQSEVEAFDAAKTAAETEPEVTEISEEEAVSETALVSASEKVTEAPAETFTAVSSEKTEKIKNGKKSK